jgi:N-acetylglucosaminyldiphosphoundecaprenol N-acetyl-beta-D-mannosaminyltransferase
MKHDIAGVFIDGIGKKEALEKILEFAKSGKQHLVATVYSEFIVFASKDKEYREILNSADLALPDGIGILWAAKYLSAPNRSKARNFFELLITLSSLIFYPPYCRTVIGERVSGSELVYDLARLAEQNKLSLSLFGGYNDVAQKAAFNLKKLFPQLEIKLAVSDRPFDESAVDMISRANSDILLIACSPPKQEKWLFQNLKSLNVGVAMGLGGTFDYLAGIKTTPPKAAKILGLEWLFRLITQPWRIARIYNATFRFIGIIYSYKANK